MIGESLHLVVLFAVVDGPGEEGEDVEEEKDRVLPERVMWYPHEDSFVGPF